MTNSDFHQNHSGCTCWNPPSDGLEPHILLGDLLLMQKFTKYFFTHTKNLPFLFLELQGLEWTMKANRGNINFSQQQWCCKGYVVQNCNKKLIIQVKYSHLCLTTHSWQYKNKKKQGLRLTRTRNVAEVYNYVWSQG